jgi:hypothetical protein
MQRGVEQHYRFVFSPKPRALGIVDVPAACRDAARKCRRERQ